MTLPAPALVGRGALRLARRGLVVVLGSATVVVGLLLIPLPGPGSLIVFLGVSLLGREFEWARRLSIRARRDATRALALAPGRGARAALGTIGVLTLVAPLLLLVR